MRCMVYLIGNDGYPASSFPMNGVDFSLITQVVSQIDLVKDCDLRRIVIERLEVWEQNVIHIQEINGKQKIAILYSGDNREYRLSREVNRITGEVRG